MIPYPFTPIPNLVLDTYLKRLKPTELALLLVVIRQTYGWAMHGNKVRKKQDWISGGQLREKTGYSRKSISTALGALVKLRLIIVRDFTGREMYEPKDRKGKTRLYYSFHYVEPVDIIKGCVKSTQEMRKKFIQQKKLLLNKLAIHY